jgi:hypothetical protein
LIDRLIDWLVNYINPAHVLCFLDQWQLWNGRKDNFLDPLLVINAHREPCRCVSVAPTDRKFASASDDATIKVSESLQVLPEVGNQPSTWHDTQRGVFPAHG